LVDEQYNIEQEGKKVSMYIQDEKKSAVITVRKQAGVGSIKK
jgi:hypothetical protein